MRALVLLQHVRRSMCHTLVLYQNDKSVMISSPPERPKILHVVYLNIRLIQKFESAHPERGH